MGSTVNNMLYESLQNLFEMHIQGYISHDHKDITHLLPWTVPPEPSTYSEPLLLELRSDSEEEVFLNEELQALDALTLYYDHNGNDDEGTFFQSLENAIGEIRSNKRSREEISTLTSSLVSAPPQQQPSSFLTLPADILPTPVSAVPLSSPTSMSSSSHSTPLSASPGALADDLPTVPITISPASSSSSTSLSASFDEKITPSITKKRKKCSKKDTLKKLIYRIDAYQEIFTHLMTYDAEYKNIFKEFHIKIDLEKHRISFPVEGDVDFAIRDTVLGYGDIGILKNSASLFRWYTDVSFFHHKNEKIQITGKYYHYKTIDIPSELVSHPYMIKQYQEENGRKISLILKLYFLNLKHYILEKGITCKKLDLKINYFNNNYIISSSQNPKNLNSIFDDAVKHVVSTIKIVLDELQANPYKSLELIYA